MVSFTCTSKEFDIIGDIVARAELYWLRLDQRIDRPRLMMDLTACHANGTPLDLAGLLRADDLDFVHDIAGITNHIDRNTGKLRHCFSPRYSRRA